MFAFWAQPSGCFWRVFASAQRAFHKSAHYSQSCSKGFRSERILRISWAINASSSASVKSAMECFCSTLIWVGANLLVACKYSWAALLSPLRAASYSESSSRWVRSGDPCRSLTRRSHSVLNAGFFSHRLRVVTLMLFSSAYFSLDEGSRNCCGRHSQFKYFS